MFAIDRVNATSQISADGFPTLFEAQTELAANSMIGDVHTSVAAVQSQLEKAEYDLDQTIVRAPSDGIVVGVSLRPGQRVGSLPMRSWMSFVPSEATRLGVGIPQYAMRHVKSGQTAEVTLKLYPGRVFSATVDEVAAVSALGQLQPSGNVMAAPGTKQGAVPFGARLKLDADQDIDVASLPGGSFGTAAIYTEKVSGTHIIRRVMIRMEAWLNYVKSW
jgi:multidrug resistance efflux pump